jgi:hypothetical protein
MEHVSLPGTGPRLRPVCDAEAVRDHVDEAEDLIESLLDWRHALTTRTGKGDSHLPTTPENTLVSVSRTCGSSLRSRSLPCLDVPFHATVPLS